MWSLLAPAGVAPWLVPNVQLVRTGSGCAQRPSYSKAAVWLSMPAQTFKTNRSIRHENRVNYADAMPPRQRYSHYLPLKRHLSRTTSRATSIVKDGTKSPKDKDRSVRNSSVTQTSKRRSTMNSQRYDEAEALRRAIEASKEDAAPELADGSVRRTKRGRSDSEEYVVPMIIYRA